jgi:hypothetical protein
VDSRSLGLLCRWIQAQRRCARIGCPRNPCEFSVGSHGFCATKWWFNGGLMVI